MKQALRLGYKRTYFNTTTSFSVIPKGYKLSKILLPVAPTIGLRLEGRHLSNSLRPNAPIAGEMRNNKRKGTLNKSPDVENCAVQEDVYVDEFDSFKDVLEKIDVMTVQELKTKLRSVGIPAKGRKQDLVSALKCYMEKKIVHGDGSKFTEEQTFFLSSQRTSDDANPDEEVYESSGHQLRKRGSKESGVGSEAINMEDEIPRTKRKISAKSKKASGAKLSVSNVEVSSDVNKTGRVDVSITQSEPWTILAHKKPQKDWIPYNPRTMRPSPLTRNSNFVKIVSWNVNGLRALLKLEGFSALQLAQREDFDILCLQETKLQEKDVENIKNCLIEGYGNCYWTCSVSKLGYSGTAILSRTKPLSVRYGLGISDHDSEGRLVTAEFDSFYLLSGYVPNSGDGLKRLSYRTTEWDPSLSNYMKELEKSKPVILTGDLNCAHQEIDIYNPAGNKRSAGFTDEERQSFGMNFLSRGFVDTFRKQHPNVVGYTYWGYRHGGRRTNKGWRLDYFLVSESIFHKVHDSYILPDVTGSDHCPIGLIYKL